MLSEFGRGLAEVFIWLGIFCGVGIPPLVIWPEDAEGRRAKEMI